MDLRSEAATVRALELAHRYLNRRERTTHELRRHLIGRDLDASAVDAAVAELTETGYLDDARFARLFAYDKRELQQWGSGRIRSALLSRGIDRDAVEAALAEEIEPHAPQLAGDQATEFDRAVALLQRRFPDPPCERRDRQRALGVLLRRGYELELAMNVLTAYSRGHA